jgi:hypothetical protein
MVKNCAGAINIERCPEFLSDPGKVDIFAMKMAVSVAKKMHRDSVEAAVPAANHFENAGDTPAATVRRSKASGARRGERLYNLQRNYHILSSIISGL